MSNYSSPEQRVQEAFRRHFPEAKHSTAVSAPGRVNLIGEHTDYNDGFVLPMAIDARMLLQGSLRQDKEVHLFSLDYNASDVFSLEEFGLSRNNSWSNYVRGVCSVLQGAGHSLQGMNIVLQGNVPQGAGLSSSAALEVASIFLIDQLHELGLSRVQMAKLSQQAENEFVGVNCGIMDQFISALGAKGHALFIDCRSLDYKRIPALFHGAKVVVVDSGVRRGLVDSEYNKRRQQCNQAVVQLQEKLPQLKISALRDVTVQYLAEVEALGGELAKRARHVITENQRVLDSIPLLGQGNLSAFGQLLSASHRSLRDDYEVSCPELDALVDIASKTEGCYGARMTGAGFGGCTVSLVQEERLDLFRRRIATEYAKQTQHQHRVFVFDAADGAQRSES